MPTPEHYHVALGGLWVRKVPKFYTERILTAALLGIVKKAECNLLSWYGNKYHLHKSLTHIK